MKLYFSPLACSMATRIALTELGLDATFIEVCPLTKTTLPSGDDYLAVHPLGVVPALQTDAGDVITENVAVLWHVAERAGALPEGPARTKTLEWLGFIATELHKGVFAGIFDAASSDPVKAYAVEKGKHRLGYLDARIGDREFLVGRAFGIADAYLVTILHWAQATPVRLPENVAAYLARHLTRPSVSAAIALELPLYLEEKQRRSA